MLPPTAVWWGILMVETPSECFKSSASDSFVAVLVNLTSGFDFQHVISYYSQFTPPSTTWAVVVRCTVLLHGGSLKNLMEMSRRFSLTMDEKSIFDLKFRIGTALARIYRRTEWPAYEQITALLIATYHNAVAQ